ncbi:MAG: hypothetical protein L6407_05225 [Candidatus Delongbacteria bacterium]|nr:hypothetical protein [Candidatus Delongbacteria bacterium]
MKKNFDGFIAKVEMLKSEKASEDKNGLYPVILLGIAGEIPNRSVISGTFAQNMGIESGNVYLFQATEQAEDAIYGRKFTFMPISKSLSAVEVLQAKQYLGKLKIVDVEFEDVDPDFVPDGIKHVSLESVIS